MEASRMRPHYCQLSAPVGISHPSRGDEPAAPAYPKDAKGKGKSAVRSGDADLAKAAAELLAALPAKDALESEEWTKRNHAFQDEMTAALSSAGFDVRAAEAGGKPWAKMERVRSGWYIMIYYVAYWSDDCDGIFLMRCHG